MKRKVFFSISSLLVCGVLNASDIEYPFNFDAEILWVQRDRTPSIGLVEANGTFCECGCGPDRTTTHDIIDDLSRAFAARITFNAKDKLNGTLEVRGTTPLDFSETKEIHYKGLTNVSCDLPYGYFHVSNNGTPYEPLIDVDQNLTVAKKEINGVTVHYAQPGYNTNYIEADRAKLYYSNSYFNVETNYWIHLSPRWVDYFSVSYGFGLRYFFLLDSFKETFYKDTEVSFFASGAKNHLMGAQVLFDLHVHPYTWLDWGIRLDGGALVTHLRTDFVLNDYNAEALLAKYSKQKINYGFFGDLEVFLMAKFFERAYGIFSFGGTLIHGVAQAMPNINLTTTDFGIYSQGNILYQYWSLGLGLDF